MVENAAKGTGQTQAARIGAEMRAARRALGWELPQLAESLRIRQPYLEAIEAGHVADLPGTTYALGFVRAYAAALGMDAEAVSKRFRDEAGEAGGKPALRFPAPVPRRGVPAGALILLGLVVLSGAYALWYRVTEHRLTPVETVPPIPDRLAAVAAKPAPSPQVASMLPGSGAPAPTPAAPVPKPPVVAPPVETAPAPAPGDAAGTDHAAGASHLPTLRESHDEAVIAAIAPEPVRQEPVRQEPPPQAPSQAAPQPQAVTPPPVVQAGSRIVVKTTGDAWLTIKQKGGPALLNKMMHAGESFAVPGDKAGLTLTTGFAGATVIEVDGAAIPGGLGAGGMVRRDIPLDPELLKSGKLPAAPPPRHPQSAPAQP